MRTEHHISRSTLEDFAAGRLSDALSTVAASHLSWCRECREAAGGTGEGPQEASHGAPPADAAGRGQTALEARDRLPAADVADSDISEFGIPMPLALHLDGRGLEDVAWRKVLPGVAVRNLVLPSGSAGQLRLVRLQPGKALPEHAHGGCELSLVLRGAYHDGHGRYAIGDVADLDGAAAHRPVAEDAGPCICLVAADMPVRYRSWLARLWQRLVGL